MTDFNIVQEGSNAGGQSKKGKTGTLRLILYILTKHFPHIHCNTTDKFKFTACKMSNVKVNVYEAEL